MFLTGLLQKRSSEEGDSDSGGSGTPIFGMSPPQTDFSSAVAAGGSNQSPPFQVIIAEDLYSDNPFERLPSFAGLRDLNMGASDLPTKVKPVEVSINITAASLLAFQP